MTADPRPLLSVVLPVFNEAAVLPLLFERVTKALEALDFRWEVVAVDDGSSDTSAALLRSFHAREPRWKTLMLSRNFGHQAAVSAGLHYTCGDVVAVLDADLQDPPEALGELLARWREGAEVVYAVRVGRKEHLLKRAAYAGFYRLLRRLSSIDIPLDAGDFCVMDRVVIDVLKSQPERARFVRGLRTWAGFTQVGVPVERKERAAGAPKYTLSKLFKLAFDGLVAFSSAPLRFAAFMGFLLCGLSVVSVALLLAWRAADITILEQRPAAALGWTSIVAVVLFVSGIQTLVLGIIGEYLGRMFDEAKGRSPWIVAEAHGVSPAIGDGLGWHVSKRRPAD